MNDAVSHAEVVLRAACGNRVRTRFPMAPLTTFRIGGPAALYLEPESDEDLAAAGRAIVDADLPVFVVGKGSNLLVSDEGFRGLVLRLGRGYRWVARDGSVLVAGGAMPLPALSGVALHHDLSGIEFGVAIPATLGGAVRMNAGAHGHEIGETVRSVELFLLRSGLRQRVVAADAGFAYRRSGLPEDAVVIGTELRLRPGDRIGIRARMDEAREWRRRTQPIAEPNCGSVFKNPTGDHAARLVESVGAKGLSVGGARVSTKHANFIVTEPGSRAADVVALIRQIQALVEERCGIRLETEVHLVGGFDDALH